MLKTLNLIEGENIAIDSFMIFCQEPSAKELYSRENRSEDRGVRKTDGRS